MKIDPKVRLTPRGVKTNGAILSLAHFQEQEYFSKQIVRLICMEKGDQDIDC